MFKKSKKAIFCLFFCLSIIYIFFPISIQGEESNFDEDYIISDTQLIDYQTMSLSDVQYFLEFGPGKTGSLANYTAVDISGQEKTAAEIIYQASQQYYVNPYLILVTLEKEQSLITRYPQKSTQYDWATGFACYDNRRPIEKFRGFAQQVNRTAWRFRYYLEHSWQFKYQAGESDRTLDYQWITPSNLATACLYNYTPHVKSNFLFWNIWQRWFSEPNTEYVDGSLVKLANDQGVWIIQHNHRHAFRSRAVFLSRYYENKEVKIISARQLNNFPIGADMTFPNYSLLQSPQKEIYLLANGKRQLIASLTIFRQIGFHPEEIIPVSQQDLINLPIGETITTPYPNGALLQNNITGAVWYVKKEVKHPIIDRSILLANFPYDSLTQVASSELDNFFVGSTVKFVNGTLIKQIGCPSVFVIEQEKRRPILSAEVFETLGYQWENIYSVNADVLTLHPLGKILKFSPNPDLVEIAINN
ncbi:MAG: hypothetical protein KAS12_02285 [Candidatus Aenigmarchaeota archaeon]|nr:hypothetical protein [Candidatus Aenigmarchaeota archaeon]